MTQFSKAQVLGYIAMAIGSFAIGIGEFVIMGLLPDVATDFTDTRTTGHNQSLRFRCCCRLHLYYPLCALLVSLCYSYCCSFSLLVILPAHRPIITFCCKFYDF